MILTFWTLCSKKVDFDFLVLGSILGSRHKT